MSVVLSSTAQPDDWLVTPPPAEVYSLPLRALAFGLAGAGVCGFLQGGGIAEVAAAFVLGVVVGALDIAANVCGGVFAHGAAVLPTFAVVALSYAVPTQVCTSVVVFSAFDWQLPGLMIVTAMVQRSARSILSAVSFSVQLAVGFGIALWLLPADRAASLLEACPDDAAQWRAPLTLCFSIAMVCGWNIIMDVPRGLWPWSVGLTWLAYHVTPLAATLKPSLEPWYSTLLVTILVCIMGQLVGLLTRQAPSASIISALLLLVPGVITLTNARGLVAQGLPFLVDIATDAMGVALAIAVGVSLVHASVMALMASKPKGGKNKRH